MPDFADLVAAVTPAMVELRHTLHTRPELGFEERDTARRVLDELATLGNLEIRSGVAGTGIVATLNADKPGPCVALRADMDALPIKEETELPYASQHPGRMHACGHDGHVACLVGAAKVLSHVADTLPGKVKFVFQPAEEGGGGAAVMCREGVLDDPKVDAIFALHGWPELDLGTVGVGRGAVMASMDSWSMTVRGKGTHAAYPHKGVDPIVAASHVVTALQTIASRSIDPLEAVVVTVGRFQSGTAPNIIPPTAELAGTIRALDGAVRDRAMARLDRVASQTAAALDASAEVRFHTGYPVLVNDEGAARLVAAVAREVVGEDGVRTDVPRSMGAEDFAFYAERIPAAFWQLGVRDPQAASPAMLHQPTYDFPDAALPIGIRMHCEIARRFGRNA